MLNKEVWIAVDKDRTALVFENEPYYSNGVFKSDGGSYIHINLEMAEHFGVDPTKSMKIKLRDLINYNPKGTI